MTSRQTTEPEYEHVTLATEQHSWLFANSPPFLNILVQKKNRSNEQFDETYSFSYQTKKNTGLVESQPCSTHYHTMPHFDVQKYTTVENIVRKGENACNKQFHLFSQCFLPYMTFFIFKCTLEFCMQFVLNWTNLKFCVIMD